VLYAFRWIQGWVDSERKDSENILNRTRITQNGKTLKGKTQKDFWLQPESLRKKRLKKSFGPHYKDSDGKTQKRKTQTEETQKGTTEKGITQKEVAESAESGIIIVERG
jgi:hypothetical protein